jgi:hypothetical protein
VRYAVDRRHLVVQRGERLIIASGHLTQQSAHGTAALLARPRLIAGWPRAFGPSCHRLSGEPSGFPEAAEFSSNAHWSTAPIPPLITLSPFPRRNRLAMENSLARLAELASRDSWITWPSPRRTRYRGSANPLP